MALKENAYKRWNEDLVVLIRADAYAYPETCFSFVVSNHLLQFS